MTTTDKKLDLSLDDLAKADNKGGGGGGGKGGKQQKQGRHGGRASNDRPSTSTLAGMMSGGDSVFARLGKGGGGKGGGKAFGRNEGWRKHITCFVDESGAQVTQLYDTAVVRITPTDISARPTATGPPLRSPRRACPTPLRARSLGLWRLPHQADSVVHQRYARAVRLPRVGRWRRLVRERRQAADDPVHGRRCRRHRRRDRARARHRRPGSICTSGQGRSSALPPILISRHHRPGPACGGAWTWPHPGHRRMMTARAWLIFRALLLIGVTRGRCN